MIINLQEKITDNILNKAMHYFNVPPKKLSHIRTSQNSVYEFEKNSSKFILRIGHSSRNTIAQINNEILLVNFLSRHDGPAVNAIQSINNKYIEEIEDDKNNFFIITAFTKAKGSPPKSIDDKFYQSFGKALGKLHFISKKFAEQNNSLPIQNWDGHILKQMYKVLKPNDPIITTQLNQIIKDISLLPKDQNSFGITHFDPHTGNLFIEKDNITFFDYDNIQYNWYINDIACFLFYTIWLKEKPCPENTKKVLNLFWNEYIKQNYLDSVWIKKIPLFMKLREIFIYSLTFSSYDLSDPNCIPVIIRFMKNRKYRIENKIPLIELDFNSTNIIG